MDKFADKSTTHATLYCVLIGVYCMRPSLTISPTCPYWLLLRRPSWTISPTSPPATQHWLRANWRVLHAALIDNFADKSILASSAVALTDIFADKSAAHFTLCCGLIGVYCTRPSWTTSLARSYWRILRWPSRTLFRHVDHPRNMCGVLSRMAIPAENGVCYSGLLGQCRRQVHHPRYVCGVLIGVYCMRPSWTVE
jgi:hypothetical protein